MSALLRLNHRSQKQSKSSQCQRKRRCRILYISRNNSKQVQKAKHEKRRKAQQDIHRRHQRRPPFPDIQAPKVLFAITPLVEVVVPLRYAAYGIVAQRLHCIVERQAERVPEDRLALGRVVEHVAEFFGRDGGFAKGGTWVVVVVLLRCAWDFEATVGEAIAAEFFKLAKV